MLLQLILKFLVTPENILSLLGTVLTAVAMCLIFRAWNEAWWKSLIPVYGTYILYKHTWANVKWLFVLPLIFDILGARSLSFVKKHIATNALHTVTTLAETGRLDIDVSVERLVVCLLLYVFSAASVFVITRVTYVKICGSLHITSVLLKIGTLLFPQIFLLVDYLYYKNAQGKLLKQ